MSKENVCGLNIVHAQHYAIDVRLQNWARWARPCGQVSKVSPMFKYYRPRLENIDMAEGSADTRHSLGEIDVLDAIEMEKKIVRLRSIQRIVIVWYYIDDKGSPGRLKRRLARGYSTIASTLHAARDSLCSGKFHADVV
jgi:hypothetical protein